MNRRSGPFDMMLDDPLNAETRPSAVGLADVVLFLKRRWLMIAAIFTLMVLATGAMLTKIEPSYTATAELTLIDQREQSTPIADLLTGVPLSRQLVQQEITTMRSKAFMIQVVKRLDSQGRLAIIGEPPEPLLPERILNSVKGFVSGLVKPDSPPRRDVVLPTTTDPAISDNPAPASDVETETETTTEAPATAEESAVEAEPTESLATEEEGATDPVEVLPGELIADGPTSDPDQTQEAAFVVLAEDLIKFGEAADQLASIVKIDQLGNSYVIGVSAQSTDPQIASIIANTAAAEYTRFSLRIRGEAIEQQVQLLSARVDDLGNSLEEAETAVVDFQERVMGIDNTSGGRLTRQIEDLSRRLVDARANVVRADAQYRKVLEILSEKGAIAAANVLSSPILVNVRAELSELRIDRSRAIERFGPNSSQVSAIDAVINRISEEIKIETARIVSEYETELKITQTIEASVEEDLRELEVLLLSRSRNVVELSKLRRIADANRIAYEEFLTIATESAQYKALQQATVRLLSYAEVPNSPSSPRYLIMLATAGLSSIVIGLGLALLIEAMNGRFKTARQLRQASGLPVIGSFSKIAQSSARGMRDMMKSGRPLQPNSQEKILLAEGTAVSSFLYNVLDHEKSTVVVTSSVQGEGASTVALILAQSLANQKESVLLIDAVRSLPDGPLSKNENVETVSSDPVKIKITKTDSKLAMLTLSDAEKLDPTLLSEKRRSELMKKIVDEFDYIIIDAPPVLSSAGALRFVSDADAILIASRWDSTPRQTVETCVQKLRDLNVKNMYTIMTQVNRRTEKKYEYAGFNTEIDARSVVK